MTQLLCIYPKELKTGIQMKLEDKTIEALLTNAIRWKQPKCSSRNGWINK